MKWISIIALTYTITSCVTPLENEHELIEKVLVVEGFIDNYYGPHEIKVAYLAKFAGVLNGGVVRRVDASVFVIDEFGKRTELTRESGSILYLTVEKNIRDVQSCVPGFLSREFQSNYFTPPTFKGEPGVSYTLEIVEDQTGEKYRSLFSRMPQPVPIDSILFEFKKFPSEDELEDITGVDVYAKWTDPNELDNFYWWEMEGTYKFETYQRPGQTCCVYDPRDQYGTRCWKIEKAINGSLGAMSDEFFNGSNAVKNVGFIEDNGFRFSSNEVPEEKQYHLELSQYTINEEAYEYLINVKTLSEIDGEIFDPPPITLFGNMYNVNDSHEIVVGYFGVYSKTTLTKFLHRSVLEERKYHRLCGDCRHFKFQGQLEIPNVYK